MPESTAVRNRRDGLVVISDFGSTHAYTVAYETGDFSFSVPLETVTEYLDRGSHTDPPSIRNVDDQPITGTFTAYARDLGSTTYATLCGLLFGYAGDYITTTWTNTHTTSDVTTRTLAFTVDGTFASESDKTLTFPYVVLRGSFAEGDPDTLSISFTSYVNKPTRS